MLPKSGSLLKLRPTGSANNLGAVSSSLPGAHLLLPPAAAQRKHRRLLKLYIVAVLALVCFLNAVWRGARGSADVPVRDRDFSTFRLLPAASSVVSGGGNDSGNSGDLERIRASAKEEAMRGPGKSVAARLFALQQQQPGSRPAAGLTEVDELKQLAELAVLPAPERRRAELRPAEVMPQSADACAQAVGSGKVAILFLTRADLYHEAAWRLWFRSAANVLPAEAVGNATCRMAAPELAAAAAACNSSATDDAISGQHLFSVYVHAVRGVPDSEMGALWRERLVGHRVAPQWGTHDLVEAVRSLLWEAYRDPANQRFVLLSESDIPLWDPQTFYRQLMSEQRSRVNAWSQPATVTNDRRWTWRMALSPARIQRSDWRKSSQWFSLVRPHAEVVLRDEAVYRAFEEYCSNGQDDEYKRWRDCFSDEHYLSTLLHMAGLEEETVPSMAGVTATDWSRGGPHPREYKPQEVTAALFTKHLRTMVDCPGTAEQHAETQRAAQRTFVSMQQAFGQERGVPCSSSSSRGSAVPALNTTLPATCSLAARKFGRDSAEAVASLFAGCGSGLGMVRDDVCRAAAAELPTGRQWSLLGMLLGKKRGSSFERRHL